MGLLWVAGRGWGVGVVVVAEEGPDAVQRRLPWAGWAYEGGGVPQAVDGPPVSGACGLEKEHEQGAPEESLLEVRRCRGGQGVVGGGGCRGARRGIAAVGGRPKTLWQQDLACFEQDLVRLL